MAKIKGGNLKKIGFFRGLSDDDLTEIAKFSSEYSFNSGELCLYLGKEVDTLQIVLAGKVGVESIIPDAPTGRKDLVLATLGAGEVYSWSGLFRRAPTASIRALEATKTLHVDAQKLLELCEKNNKIGYIIMKNLALTISARLKRHRLAMLKAIAGFGEGW